MRKAERWVGEFPSKPLYNSVNINHEHALLFRFSRLRSLNLSNNHLRHFPLAICDISTLMEVNLSCNYLSSVPSSVGAMTK